MYGEKPDGSLVEPLMGQGSSGEEKTEDSNLDGSHNRMARCPAIPSFSPREYLLYLTMLVTKTWFAYVVADYAGIFYAYSTAKPIYDALKKTYSKTSTPTSQGVLTATTTLACNWVLGRFNSTEKRCAPYDALITAKSLNVSAELGLSATDPIIEAFQYEYPENDSASYARLVVAMISSILIIYAGRSYAAESTKEMLKLSVFLLVVAMISSILIIYAGRSYAAESTKEMLKLSVFLSGVALLFNVTVGGMVCSENAEGKACVQACNGIDYELTTNGSIVSEYSLDSSFDRNASLTVFAIMTMIQLLTAGATWLLPSLCKKPSSEVDCWPVSQRWSATTSRLFGLGKRTAESPETPQIELRPRSESVGLRPSSG